MAIITSSIGTAGRDYSTLQAWEDALPASAVTAGNSYVGEGYNDSEFTGSAPLLTIAGVTTDSTHTITLKCGAGQSFYDHANKLTNQLKYDQSKGVGIRATSAFLNSTIDVQTEYTTIDGLQVGMDANGGYSCVTVSSNNTVVKNCIASKNSASSRGAFRSTAATNFVNCLAIVVIADTVNAFDPQGGGGCYNCTAVKTNGAGVGTAYSRDYASPVLLNCAAFGFQKFGRDTTGGSGSGYNCTDVASGNTPGSNNLYSKTFASQFEDITNTSAMDFRVKTGADLINAGSRDATNTADLDIVKSARSTTTPTIGAWEFAASGATYTVTADVGTFTYTGVAAGLQVARKLTAAVGSYSLSGVDASLVASRKLTAATGAFTLTGVDAALQVARKLTAEVGAFTLTGVAANLVYTPAGGVTYTLVADAGAFTLSGVDASLVVARKISAATGSFTLTGVGAELQAARKLAASVGSYTLSGVAAALQVARKLSAGIGSYTYTGYAASLVYGSTSYKATVLLSGVISKIPQAQVGTGLKPIVWVSNRFRQRQVSEGTPLIFDPVTKRWRLLHAGETLEV